MLALGDGAGVDMSGLPTFPNGRPLSPPSATAISNDALRCTPEISPVNTVRGDSDEPGDSKPEFRLSQCFGDCSPAEEVTQADILSAVQFDHTGEYLATGDRGGRVVIFRKNSGGLSKVTSSGKVRRANDYKFFTEFQSHETEFDYLKSLEIEEKINAIKWCPRANGALFLLSTNDKTVKLWKIREKRMKKVAYPERISRRGGQTLELPQVSVADPNSDGEHFISTDDLRINLWNLEITDRSYILERPAELSTKSFFSEIVASISDIKSTPDGRYIISRDYMTLKLWDVNMEARPVKTINVHEHLRPQLCDLYENDCIFDKFECAVSGDTNSVLTGSYNNMCHIYDRYGQNKGSLEVCKDASKKCGGKKGKGRLTRDSAAAAAGSGAIDYGKKILHMSWHPQDDIVAVAGNDKLYIYSAIR